MICDSFIRTHSYVHNYLMVSTLPFLVLFHPADLLPLPTQPAPLSLSCLLSWKGCYINLPNTPTDLPTGQYNLDNSSLR